MMFDQMVQSLTTSTSSITFRKNITLAQYQKWKTFYTWDAIQQIRYGQSFCNYFDITDYRIFYEPNCQRVDALIQREYVQPA
jgi:hypothetical protein